MYSSFLVTSWLLVRSGGLREEITRNIISQEVKNVMVISWLSIYYDTELTHLGNGFSLDLVLKRSGGSIILCAGIASILTGMDPEAE